MLSTSSDPDKNAARVLRAQWDRYKNLYTPVGDRLAGSLGEDTTRQAVAGSLASVDRADAMSDRMQERFGISRTPEQAQAQDSTRSRTRALAALEATNTARDADFDRDRSIRTGLVDVGQGLVNQATGGLVDAAGMQGQRETAHQNALAQHRQQRNANTMQMVSTGGALAGMGYAAGLFSI